MQGVERLKVIGRENLIRQLAYKENKMVIDLTEEACIIACRDENNNIMRITSEGIGLKKGPWVREAVSLRKATRVRLCFSTHPSVRLLRTAKLYTNR